MSTPEYYNTPSAFPIDIQYQGIAILIVDDEVGICELLKKALGRMLCQIDTACSIKEAEELRQRHHYDLVILDIYLPD